MRNVALKEVLKRRRQINVTDVFRNISPQYIKMQSLNVLPSVLMERQVHKTCVELHSRTVLQHFHEQLKSLNKQKTNIKWLHAAHPGWSVVNPGLWHPEVCANPFSLAATVKFCLKIGCDYCLLGLQRLYRATLCFHSDWISKKTREWSGNTLWLSVF